MEGAASGLVRGIAQGLWLVPLAFLGCSKPSESVPVVAPLSAEIRAAAVERGKGIVAETFSLLSSNLQSAIEQGGVSNALPYCSLAASPLTSGMADKHGVTIRRVTHKARNPADRADAVELAILKQFEATLHGVAATHPPPMATNLNAHTVSFFAPIVLNKELCLKCHGQPGKDIATENMDVIQRLYPQDEATGFKLGDLRGAWRIDFSLATLTQGN